MDEREIKQSQCYMELKEKLYEEKDKLANEVSKSSGLLEQIIQLTREKAALELQLQQQQ